MEVLTVGGTANLEISAKEGEASRWVAFPPGMVDLAPDDSGRACLATGKLAGLATVKAMSEHGQTVGLWSLSIQLGTPLGEPLGTPLGEPAEVAPKSAP